MLDVKRHILEKRLKLYATLHKTILHNSTLIASPVIKEQYYWSLINGMPFRIGDQKMEYVSYFDSYEKIYEYCLMIQETYSKSVFLPKDINETLDLINEWYYYVLEFLTAFKMMEEEDKSLNDKQRREHIDLACNIFGIALQYDIEYISNYLKCMLADRLRMPSLLNLFRVSVINKYKLWLFNRKFNNMELYKHHSFLMLLLLFIHISDMYTRDEYDDLPEDIRKDIMKKFHKSIIKYLPHD